MNNKANLQILISATAWLLVGGAAGAAEWPDLSQPAKAIGGGEADAAVVSARRAEFAPEWVV